jgi:putative DNA primase/helicase
MKKDWKAFQDQVAAVIDFQAEYEALGVRDLKESGDSIQGYCPIHDDQNTRSFSFFKKTGYWKCFAGCGSGSLYDLDIRINGGEFRGSLFRYASKYSITPPAVAKPPRPPISEDVPAKYHAALLSNQKRLDWLITGKRGLTLPTIQKYQIGWNGDRYTIPVRDAQGTLVNIRVYDRQATDDQYKMISYSIKDGDIKHTYGETRLYGLDEFLKAPEDKPIIICEGEWDRLILEQNGFHAMTGTTGVGTFKPEWKDLFRGRHAYVCFDNDDPGRSGALKVAEILHKTAASVHIIALPDDVGHKGDVTDFFVKLKRSTQDFQDLMISAAEYTPPQQATPAPGPQNKPAEASSFTMSDKFYPRLCTDEIRRNNKFFCEGPKGLLWRYDPDAGLWKSNGDAYIEFYFRTLTSSINDTLKRKNVISEIIADVRGCTFPPSLDGMPEPKLNLIPFRNGVYDIDTDRFRNHDARDYFTFQLPWNYNPAATCPFLEKVINSFLPEDQNITLWELLAYSLYRSYSYQKFFMLAGPGSNGKGTYSTILSRMIGRSNCSSVSLHEIQNQRFAGASLMNKHVNIAGEMTYDDIKNTDLLKQLCGGDVIRADRKFLSAVNFINHAKLIFATNSIPQTKDCSDAFYRRAFLIQFTKQFPKNPGFETKLRSDTPEMIAEFEGLIMKVITHLKSLKAQNFIFTHDISIQESRKIYQALSNPLTQFIAQYADRTGDSDDYIIKVEFREKLNDWLQDQGLNTYTEKRIARSMAELGIENGRATLPDKKQPYVWTGLKWRKEIEKAPVSGEPENEKAPVSENSALLPLLGLLPISTPDTYTEGIVVNTLATLANLATSEEKDPEADWCQSICRLSEGQRPHCERVIPCPKMETAGLQ